VKISNAFDSGKGENVMGMLQRTFGGTSITSSVNASYDGHSVKD